jgi:zinc protease
MAKLDLATLRAWLDRKTPGQRLLLMLLAIGGVTGVLSLLGSPGSTTPPATNVASAGAVATQAAPKADTPADVIGGPGERPGAAGKPVKTITVAKGPETSAGGGTAPPASAPSGALASAPASAPTPTPQAKPGPTAETAAKLVPELKTVETKMNIQNVKSPGGISAWLVEEHSVPLLALRFVFDGGSSQDPAGKDGLANFLTAMMDEGAGDLDAAKFQERMEELAIKMSFEDSRDALYGNFETLTANRNEGLELLKLAVNKPRFDAEAVERIRKQLLANLAYAAKNPQQVAGKTWYAAAFPGHAYGRSPSGSPETIAAIQPADLEAYRKRVFARDTLKVVAVGDITAKELGDLLDQVFSDLPATAELVDVPKTAPAPTEKLRVVEMDVPQSVVQFGMPGLGRKDPDFIPAFVMNQILGGGGFASRLTEEVREKRGLAYSVYSYMQPYRHAATFAGGVATKNEAVKESIDVIRAELQRMATDGPTATELANAKSFLTGSFALRFDTNSKIANQLLWMLHEDMGIDYVSTRNAQIDAVTMEDVRRAAQRVLKVDDLFVTVVGKPVGLGG